jgi:hypothetical protein
MHTGLVIVRLYTKLGCALLPIQHLLNFSRTSAMASLQELQYVESHPC